MSINLSNVSATVGLSMSPQIFSGSLLQQDIGWQYLSINPASTQFNLVGDFTIEAWVCPTSTSGLAVIDARTSGGSASPWLLWILNNGSGCQILFFDGSYHYGTNIVPVNVWSHVAIVRLGSTLTFYLNGEVDTVIAYTNDPISPGSTSPVVGSKDGGNPWYGYVSNLRVVVGVAVYTSAFTPSTSPLTTVQPENLNGNPSSAIRDNQTVLLLNTDYNGFNFLDRSHNNFTLLNSNMPVPNALSPFFPASSISFNGTSDYLIVNNTPNTAFDFGTGDFTVEAWVNLTYNPSGLSQIVGGHNSGSSANWVFGIFGAPYGGDEGKVIFYGQNGSTQVLSTSTVAENTWTHVAFSMVSGTGTIYINGVASGSGAVTIGYGTPITIGDDNTSSPNAIFNGYISNLRVVKGIGVYTTDFTPSNHALTSTQLADVNGSPSAAISGTETSLLLTTPYSINYLADSSSHNFTITKVGSPSPAGSDAGSSYFYNTNFNIAAATYGSLFDQDGAFTIECWYYPTDPSAYGYASLWTINAQFWDCNYDSSPSGGTAGKFIFNCPYIGNIVTTDTFTTYNTWYHVALSSDGTTTRAFINGTLQGTFTGTGVVQTSGNPLTIGLAYNGPYGYPVLGNLSNFRMVKGVAVYTSAFTPSTNPLTAVQAANVNGSPSAKITGDQTVLLLNTPNNILNHLDSSSYQLITTTPSTPVPAAWNPYNLGSISFNGSTDYLTTTNFNFSTNNFTIEGWFYPTSLASGIAFWGQDNGIGPNPKITLYTYGDNLYLDTSGEGPSISVPSSTLNIDQWNHIAFVRIGLGTDEAVLFINGVSVGSFQLAGDLSGISAPFNIGYTGEDFGGTLFLGEISNFRIVNGVAVYTGTFTVPTQPLNVSQIAGTNINSVVPEQTVLLLNTPDNPNNLLDSSIYNLTVTPTGTPTAIVNNPFGPL